ncbi:phage tail tube protein [Pseudomonas sp. GD03721]|jgi:hypothetical protein|nr:MULTISPECIES: phage tail tube protein [unclassified Pseudomonas]MDH1442062.1 phage tail tube protein [Pseudomonas sp. GD03722]WGG02702.1 phage tail tube protein [Pseudomonas sp. GD03721]WGG06870.1 phage tail tube protein [Pseudomonas sp. GD03919]
MGQKVAGTVYIKIDGAQLVITGGVEAPLNKYNRETIVKGHFKEEDVIPFLKVDAVKTKGVDWAKVAAGVDLTVTAEFKDGSTYVLTGAYVVGDLNVTGDDGKVAIEFNGAEGDWQ